MKMVTASLPRSIYSILESHFHVIIKMKMASQCAATALAASPSHLVLQGFHPAATRLALAPKITPFFQNLRFENRVRLERRPRLFAKRSNPRDGAFSTEKLDGNAIEAGDSGKESPPFLTILAGFLVFLLVCWILGSVVMWVIGLIISLLPSK